MHFYYFFPSQIKKTHKNNILNHLVPREKYPREGRNDRLVKNKEGSWEDERLWIMRWDQTRQFNKGSFKKVHWSDPLETGYEMADANQVLRRRLCVCVSVNVYLCIFPWWKCQIKSNVSHPGVSVWNMGLTWSWVLEEWRGLLNAENSSHIVWAYTSMIKA